MLHLPLQQFLHTLGLPLRALHDQLVVNLEHQPGLQPLRQQPVPYIDHSQLVTFKQRGVFDRLDLDSGGPILACGLVTASLSAAGG